MKRYLAALLCFALLVTSMATPIDFVTIRAAAMESGMSESDNSQDSNETVDTNLETPPDTTNKDLNTPEDDEKEPAAPPEGEEGEKDPITPPEGGEGETDPTTPPEGGEGETDPATPPEGGENETDPATPPEGGEGETDPITPPEGDPNAPATGENVPAPNLPVEGEAGEDKPKSSLQMKIEADRANESTYKAKKTLRPIDVNEPITEAVWGTPSVTINQSNASLYKHNAQDKDIEDVSADLYFRWDSDYLYFGVVSSDSDIRETNGYWEGDGIQFHLEAGNTISNGGFSDFCLTMGPEEYINDKGETKFGQFGVGGNSNNQEDLTQNVKKKIIAQNGVIYMMMAIPHNDMGAFAEAGEQYAINLLRIIGDQYHEYHGWLDWGGYFDDKGYDSGSAYVIELSDEAPIQDEGPIKANKTARAIDVNTPITEAVWGTPSITINKNNASLYRHNAQDKEMEEVSADLYFRWDKDYLYFGVVSSDGDIRETNGYWEGDGIQFHLEAGDTISNGGFSDFCLTMGPEEYVNDKGETKFGQFGVGGNSNNQEALTQNVKKKIIAQNGVIYMMMAIPHNDMGALAEAGEQYAINLLRIIGDQYHEYHGWLDWGGYFDDKGYDSGSAYVIELSDESPVQDEEPIKANKTNKAIDVTKPITEAVWGTPSVTINKDNASLYKHNAQDKEMEEVSADLYFRWDKDYLYFGVVSSDSDIRETNGYWEGDGIQFHLEAGDTISNGGFSDFCLTMGPEEYVNDKGETKFGQFGVGGNSSNQAALTKNVKKKIIAENGVIYMMMAIPHADMGANPVAGEQYAINLLRIIGDQFHEYHGWLDWGGYFTDKGYDSGSAKVITLYQDATTDESIKAPQVLGPIDISKPIKEDTWGTPSVTINKDNASLYKHNAQEKEMEEVSADLYFRWDKDYLYFGVVSSDSDIRETNGYWEGDGIQFHLEAGDTISNGGFSDFCLTMGPEEYVNDKGETKFGQFGVGGNSSNQAALTKNVKKKIIAENGVIYMMMAIPHADMGANPVAGEQYAINLLRIIGDQFHEYHGWLDWGGYFTDKGYDSGSASVVVLDSEILPVGNYLAAEKVDTAIDVTIPITEAVWGTPTITINKDNASLYKHNAQEKEMEEVSADLYFRWDKDYLYFGVASSDSDIRETNSYWEGDGIQFHLEAGNTISNGGFSDFCLTMGPEEYVNDKGETKFGQFGVGGNSSNQAALTKNVKKKIIAENGVIYMMMAIPHTDMGANPVAGEQYAINLLRIIGDQFHEYHGWLDWGGYFTDKGYDSTPSKVIVLYEKGSGGSSGEVVTGSLFDITGAVGGTADKEGFNDTLKLAKVGDDIYTAYMTGSNTFTSSSGYKALNEISMYKVSGKTVTDLGRLYTRAGDVDVLATGGSVYVVGGSSNFVIKETSSKGTAGTEKAVLNVWTCSNGKEIANGHTTQKSFPSTKNKYNYLTSSVSPDGKFIYAFYLADTSLAWFTFDISSNKWIGDAKTQELSGTAEKAYVFNKNNSLSFVYVSGGKVFETAVTASASSREILSGVTEVKDIYLTSDGKLCVLYSSADGVSISIDGTASPIKSMASTDYGRLSQNSKGEVNILAMEKDKPATAKVLSANGSNVKSITLDSKNAASSVPVIAAPRGGTPLTGKVQMMFPARYRATNHWYYTEIALD